MPTVFPPDKKPVASAKKRPKESRSGEKSKKPKANGRKFIDF